MPNSKSFTITHTGRANVLISECGVSEAFDPLDTSCPHPELRQLRAIWDTGATNSCVSEEAIKRVGLVATGKVNVSTAGGDTRADTYLANIQLPNGVGFAGVRVTSCKLANADMLIGMDIIGSGDFAVTNHDGKTVMTFRVPSSKVIDFVTEHHQDQAKEQAQVARTRFSKNHRKGKKGKGGKKR